MKNVLIFVTGVAVGSAVTWKLIKDKYVQMAQEEIDSVKQAFSDRDDGKDNVTDEQVKAEAYKDIYREVARSYGADINYSEQYKIKDEKETNKVEVTPMTMEKDIDRPYVISPEEFGELDDYEQISLTYHADNVLTDDDYELVDDVDDTVGYESLTHFGEYEDDSVFVRNDRLKCDYEILLDHRKYSEIITKMPYLMRD